MTNRRSRLTTALAGVLTTTGLAAVALSTSTASAATTERPVLSIPFPCGQEWRGATYSYHNPQWAIDFNQGSGDSDLGRQVMASAAGTVTAAGTGPGGYGKQVIISHGSGWSTQYAHLQDGSITVSVGQRVAANKIIGRVGKTGGQSSSHLHYEQRLNGADQKIKFGTSSFVTYYATDYFTRIRNC